MTYSLFAVTLPGLESITAQELTTLGFKPSLPQATLPSGEKREETGGVEFGGDLKDMYRANLHLRTANRVLARLGEFNVTTFAELRYLAGRLAWDQILRPGQAVALRVTCHKSRLYHSAAVAERVAGAISDRLGGPCNIQKFDEDETPLPQLIIIRLAFDHCTISLDTSGALLHRRGYRLETAKAPLRETLAASLLLLAGWDPCAPLLDPFCGSGTIAIEAALLARQIAPGKNRHFAFMDWPNFSPSHWHTALSEAAALERPLTTILQASDRDAGAVRIAQSNAARAGVLENIQLSCWAFSAIQPPHEPGWVITNPPYGVRVSSNHDLRNLYAQLGNVLRVSCPGWKFGALCATEYLFGHTHLKVERNFSLSNGGIPVKFFIGTI